MDNLNVLIPVLGTILGIIISHFLKGARRRMRRLERVKEVYSLYEKVNSDFKTKVLSVEMDEASFLALTNIKTNVNNIQKFIDLKNLLGDGWDLERIGVAHPKLKITELEVTPNVSWLDRCISNLLLGLYIVIMVAIIALCYSLNKVWSPLSIEETLAYLLFFFILIGGIAKFLDLVGPILMARAMERRLKIVRSRR